ncbi:glutathione-dependent formaldehyde-activating enzyme [Seiridium cupressi]
MTLTRIVRLVGTIFLLAALALLLMLDIAAPTFTHLGLFTVSNDFTLYNDGTPIVSYGSFGYCVRVIPEHATQYPTQTACVQARVGYDATSVIDTIYGYHSAVIPSNTALNVAKLTKVFVLIPIATASCAIAVGLRLYSFWRRSIVASVLAAVVSTLTFTVSFVATVCAFVAFGAIKSALEKDGTSTRGDYDVGSWALLVATICNCHCAKFRFEVALPEIKSAVSCNCVACFKTGILWAFPADGDYTVIRDDGLLATTQHRGALDHKIRTLLGVDPFPIEQEQSNHPAAKLGKVETTVDSDGLKIYQGSCTCGAVSLTLKTKPLTEVEIKEDNCSTCVRNAYIGVYPSKPQVETSPSSDSNASTYASGQGFSGSRFCKHCGVKVFSDLYGPPAELVATWPEARQAMVARKLNIKPLNVRALEGVDWDQLQVQRSDEGTEGYVVD